MRKITYLFALVLAFVGLGASAQVYSDMVVTEIQDQALTPEDLKDGGLYIMQNCGQGNAAGWVTEALEDTRTQYRAVKTHGLLHQPVDVGSSAASVFTLIKNDDDTWYIRSCTGLYMPNLLPFHGQQCPIYLSETAVKFTLEVTEDGDGKFMIVGEDGEQLNSNPDVPAGWGAGSGDNGCYYLTAVTIGPPTPWMVLQQLIEKIQFDASEWPAGDAPGFYSQSLIDNCQEAWDYAVDLTEDESDETLSAAATALKDAYEALKNGQVPVTFGAGYYYLLNARDTTSGSIIEDLAATTDLDAAYCNGAKAVWSTHFDATVSGPDAEPQYIWQFIAASDTSYYVKNIGFDAYIGASYGIVPNVEDAYEFRVATSVVPGGFVTIENLKSPGNGWATGVTGKVIGNGNINNGASAWKAIAVSEETVAAMGSKCEALQKAYKQSLLNDTLQKYYDLALSAQAAGKSYKFDGTNDGIFSTEEGVGLLTDASQVISNACDPDEGSYDGLFDGDYTSFFHSSWHASAPADEPHYLQMDLGKEVQTLVLKYAERPNTEVPDLPYNVSVYATNDANLLTKTETVYNEETGEEEEQLVNVPTEQWTKINDVVFDWSIQLKDIDGDDVTLKCKRTAAPVLMGAGITTLELGAKYKYVRIAVNTNMQHAVTGSARSNGDGFDYWNLSELRAYEATYDPNCVYAHMDKAAVESLESNIVKASAELKAEAATQATIDALKAAYEAFLAVYPDKNKLQAAIDEAESWLEDAAEGDAPGEFTAGATEELNTAIEQAKSTLTEVLTFALYDKTLKDLDAAVAEFQTKFITPQDGLYILRSLSTSGGEQTPGQSIVYALTNRGNGTGLRWGYADDSDPDSRTNATWLVAKVDGGYTFRNIATGLYMSNADETLNNNVGQSAEPVVIGLRYARTSGGFNLVLGESLFANAQPLSGGDGAFVAWSSAKGADNSAFQFEPTTYQATVKYPVNGLGLTVLTMPFDVDAANAEGYVPYFISGKRTTSDGETLELVPASANIHAGTPFIVYPQDEEVTEVSVYMKEIDNFKAISYVTEAQTMNGLVGRLAPDTLENAIVLEEGELVAKAGKRAIPAYGGYINYEKLPIVSEAGAVTIPFDPSIVGIENVVTEKPAARKQGIFNLQGVRLQSTKNLPKGIYIINGKKVIKK